MPSERAGDVPSLVDRLRDAICICPNKEGRHACDLAAERAAEVVEAMKVVQVNG